MTTTRPPAADLGRHHDVLCMPAVWPAWPFLPVVRRRADGDEYGLLCDLTGPDTRFRVYRANLFLLPATLAAFLALPGEDHDSPEAVTAAGWRVD